MEIKKIVTKSKKRLGRGHGSGKVKTAGRGTKGQKARGKMPLGFEGGQLSLTKRLPFLRGKGRNRSQKTKAFPLPLSMLSSLPSGTTVTLELLRKKGMIDRETSRVKVVGTASIAHPLTVTIPCSKSVKTTIEKSGGTVKV